ncbi:hypothetical protein TNCV_521271 [Trichonephila clavipes]|nr:hypothetical protein TNCV_521271 [Trichonephila clavipes]
MVRFEFRNHEERHLNCCTMQRRTDPAPSIMVRSGTKVCIADAHLARIATSVRDGGNLNRFRDANTLVRLSEEEERWKGP